MKMPGSGIRNRGNALGMKKAKEGKIRNQIWKVLSFFFVLLPKYFKFCCKTAGLVSPEKCRTDGHCGLHLKKIDIVSQEKVSDYLSLAKVFFVTAISDARLPR